MSTTTFALTFLLVAENLVIVAMGFQRFEERIDGD